MNNARENLTKLKISVYHFFYSLPELIRFEINFFINVSHDNCGMPVLSAAYMLWTSISIYLYL